MKTIESYIPLLNFFFVVAIAILFRLRAATLAKNDPVLLAGYNRTIRAWSLYAGGSSVLVAIGTTLGLVRVYPLPRPEAPGVTWFDLLLYLTAMSIEIRFAYWLFAENGASILLAQRKLFKKFPEELIEVKLLGALLVAVGVVSNTVSMVLAARVYWAPLWR